MRTTFLLLVLAVLFSCEKAELPKPLTGAPSANTVSVTMGSDYANQLFFSLSTGSIVAQNNRQSWDLAFESGENGRNILLNSAKFMAVSKTNETDFANVNNSTAVEWTYDNQKGMADSLALVNWELNKIYIVDRGITTVGAQIGKVKLKVIAFSATDYTIEWAPLNASTVNTATIIKNSDYNATFFSLEGQGQVVAVEPKKAEWDLAFTSYTYIYPDGMPYLVTGVLSNRNLTKVAETPLAFDAIDYITAQETVYSDDLDIIGYDWKFYDFDLATYIIQFDKVYIIRSVEGRYYKLRFLDFYDGNGSKGTPSFELQEIVP